MFLAFAIAAILIVTSTTQLLTQFLGPLPNPLRLLVPLNLTGTYGLTVTTGDVLTLGTVTASSYVITGYNSNSGATGHTYTVTTGTITGPS